MRLTAASLGALKLDADVTDKIFFDTDVPGFGLRVRASARAAFGSRRPTDVGIHRRRRWRAANDAGVARRRAAGIRIMVPHEDCPTLRSAPLASNFTMKQ